MRIDTPLGHGVEDLGRVVDDHFETGRVEELELGVSDEAADLEDVVVFRIETGHLA